MHVAACLLEGSLRFENVAHGCAGFASLHFETGWAFYESESGASRLVFLYVGGFLAG